MQTFAFKRPARDDALCFGTINNFPRLADALVRGQLFPKSRLKPSRAPDSLHKDWLKGEGTDDLGFRASDFGFQIGIFVGRFYETPFIFAPDTDAYKKNAIFSQILAAVADF